MSKKMVLKLGLLEEKHKKKAMTIVSGISGVESIQVDMKEKKLTVVGAVDPVNLVSKLRKLCDTEIVSVGPAKDDKKKADQPNKDESKKDDAKKGGGGGGGGGQKKKDEVAELLRAQQAYNPHMTSYYHVTSAEENPNACVIC